MTTYYLTYEILCSLGQFGKERRKKIRDLFNSENDIVLCVNTSHSPIVDKDPDLKKLIKKGFLKKISIYFSPKSKRSYLVKNSH